MKKINILGTVGLPASYGGWETLVENLAKNISADYEITVFCSEKKYSYKMDTYLNCKLKYLKLNANGFQSIFYDFISMIISIKSDVMLILGVSGCIFLPLIKIFYNGKIIVNIDGMEWKRDKWGKLTKMFLKLSEYMAVKFANIIITDNVGIEKYVKEFYDRDSVMIPYGADHAIGNNQYLITTRGAYKYRAFKVCRIEPENNIDLILKTFRSLPDFQIMIIGNWNNSEFGREMYNIYSQFSNIKLLQPIYDINSLNFYRRNTDIYIHGHSAGGTNPSLVEAMFLSLPIFSFDVIYNRETTLNSCKYFSSENELAMLLKSSTDENLTTNGAAMKIIANEKYNWNKISQQYSNLFR